ncbi:hypothetical protein CAEBREN_15989 [Caenorhabditis brenneri]|uniref:MATH domain-containing protein n=1 Tax=Caenorhabditis brenneri TaxID=135651 RepID=G0P313_CAEBE|nr:hypothetical protein CAEBREN_15989 [Caenorhabditis brenneri]
MPQSFVSKHRFKNVLDMKENEKQYNEEEVHGNIPWTLNISKVKDGLSLYLNCNKSPKSDFFTVQTEVEYKIFSKTQRKTIDCKVTFTNKPEHQILDWGYAKFMSWDRMKWEFLENGCLDVEVRVEILKTEGIERFLASQSSHFKHLLMEADSENLPPRSLTQRLFNKTLHAKSQFMDQFKGRHEVTLEDVDPNDFQVFLEVLYGEPAIDDDTVGQLLLMSITFQTDTVTRRCEEFLVQKSEKRIQRKFELALEFELEKLKKHCVTSFKSVKDLKAAIPSDLSRIDRPLLEELFQKSLSF